MLSPGTRLGPYEVVSLIGAGGMGQVYKARDTRLDRAVAIKLLPPHLADRPDRRRRFETEARAISALSHPHICPLFDVGEADGRAFLVMEYLEGETLDDRVTRGALPAHDVLRFGSQIADALDHAHRAQIIHRDLKPSNVMLTESGAKLLDFGLAKRADIDPPHLETTASLEQRKLTAEGTVIGTVQYMAPEQLEGRSVDARTDIFALGMVLYEMATGRKAFAGESHASIIASILTAQPPPVSSIRPAEGQALPAVIDHIVERCLAKSPSERWQTAREIKLELDWASKASSQSAPSVVQATRRRQRSRSEVIAWVLVAASLAAAAGVAFIERDRESAPETTRFSIAPKRGRVVGVSQNRSRLAISPDGRRIAFQATENGRQQIWVHSLESFEAQPLAGTDGGSSPFWSPDSRFIGFYVPTAGEIRKIEVSGGPARTICSSIEARDNPLPVQHEGSLTWGRDGTILFTQFRDGLFRVSADGGTAIRVTQVDKSKGEMNHYWPSFLPDGRHFFYMATAIDASQRRVTPSVYVGSLDDPAAITLVTRLHSKMVYVASGHVLFVEDGTLMAQVFDVATRRLQGDPFEVATGVAYFKTLGNAAFDISDSGVLAYQGASDTFRLVWYDRRGTATETGWAPQHFGKLRVSPDALHFVADVMDPRTGMSDILMFDLARGAPIRLTNDGYALGAIWAPDGRRIVMNTARSQAPALMILALDGAEEKLVDRNSPLTPEDWSPDGQLIAFSNNTRTAGSDLSLLPVSGDRKDRPFASSKADEWGAMFSPDSSRLAFASNEFGPPEIYVGSVDGREKTRISVGGGTSPRWRRDGKELFYMAADHRSLMAVPVELGPPFKAGQPVRLFTMPTEASSSIGLMRYTGYDVLPDGQRFLLSVPVEAGTSRINVVINWMTALSR